jgi:hypothetical protein
MVSANTLTASDSNLNTRSGREGKHDLLTTQGIGATRAKTHSERANSRTRFGLLIPVSYARRLRKLKLFETDSLRCRSHCPRFAEAVQLSGHFGKPVRRLLTSTPAATTCCLLERPPVMTTLALPARTAEPHKILIGNGNDSRGAVVGSFAKDPTTRGAGCLARQRYRAIAGLECAGPAAVVADMARRIFTPFLCAGVLF